MFDKKTRKKIAQNLVDMENSFMCGKWDTSMYNRATELTEELKGGTLTCNPDSCSTCPFRTSEYDDWAVGDDTVFSCGLQNFLGLPESSIITTCNMSDIPRVMEKPEWCPLNNLKITVSNESSS